MSEKIGDCLSRDYLNSKQEVDIPKMKYGDFYIEWLKHLHQ